MYKVPKMYEMYPSIDSTTNLHNRFFLIRLCGFALSPNNLITSILRTSCGHFLSPPQKVRRNCFQHPLSLKINTPFRHFHHMSFYKYSRVIFFVKKNRVSKILFCACIYYITELYQLKKYSYFVCCSAKS